VERGLWSLLGPKMAMLRENPIDCDSIATSENGFQLRAANSLKTEDEFLLSFLPLLLPAIFFYTLQSVLPIM